MEAQEDEEPAEHPGPRVSTAMIFTSLHLIRETSWLTVFPILGGSRAFHCPASAVAQDQEVQDAHLRPQSGQCQPKHVPQQLNIQIYRSEVGDLP